HARGLVSKPIVADRSDRDPGRARSPATSLTAVSWWHRPRARASMPRGLIERPAAGHGDHPTIGLAEAARHRRLSWPPLLGLPLAPAAGPGRGARTASSSRQASEQGASVA